jgi:trimeric autotransporter adhesin
MPPRRSGAAGAAAAGEGAADAASAALGTLAAAVAARDGVRAAAEARVLASVAASLPAHRLPELVAAAADALALGGDAAAAAAGLLEAVAARGMPGAQAVAGSPDGLRALQAGLRSADARAAAAAAAAAAMAFLQDAASARRAAAGAPALATALCAAAGRHAAAAAPALRALAFICKPGAFDGVPVIDVQPAQLASSQQRTTEQLPSNAHHGGPPLARMWAALAADPAALPAIAGALRAPGEAPTWAAHCVMRLCNPGLAPGGLEALAAPRLGIVEALAALLEPCEQRLSAYDSSACEAFSAVVTALNNMAVCDGDPSQRAVAVDAARRVAAAPGALAALARALRRREPEVCVLPAATLCCTLTLAAQEGPAYEELNASLWRAPGLAAALLQTCRRGR